MSSISQLSEASAVSSSMQIPVYDSGNGQPRKVSVQQLQDYLDENADAAASGPFALADYSVAELPSASANPQSVVYCSNGDAGNPCLAVSNGTNWLRVALGAAVAASS